MSSWIPKTYKTWNWPDYNRALKRRGSLAVWFDPDADWKAKPTGKRGRNPRYSDAAIQACLTIKVLFGLPLRQTTGFVESLLTLVDLDWEVPDYSTLCRRQKTLSVAIGYQSSQGPLNLLVDSTGIKAEGEGEWNARKHGGSKRRLWRKIHIGIDEQTLEIRAIEVTGSKIGPSRQHPTDAPARQWTPPCCQTCSDRSRPIRKSAASQLMEPMTRASAMMRSRHAMRMPSYRRARTPSCGSRTPPERGPVTKRFDPQSIWAAPCGDDGPDTTGGAASKPRCIV